MQRMLVNTETGAQTLIDLTPEEVEAVGVQADAQAPPRVVDARRLRITLLNMGLLDQIEQLVAQSDRATQIEWEYATLLKEDYPLLKGVVAALGWSKSTVDQIFIQASEKA